MPLTYTPVVSRTLPPLDHEIKLKQRKEIKKKHLLKGVYGEIV